MTVLPFPTPSVRCIHVELAEARVAEAKEAHQQRHYRYVAHMNTASWRGCACRSGGLCPVGARLDGDADAASARLALAKEDAQRARRQGFGVVR